MEGPCFDQLITKFQRLVMWLAPRKPNLMLTHLLIRTLLLNRETVRSQIQRLKISKLPYTIEESCNKLLYVDRPKIIMPLKNLTLMTELSLFAPPTNEEDQTKGGSWINSVSRIKYMRKVSTSCKMKQCVSQRTVCPQVAVPNKVLL